MNTQQTHAVEKAIADAETIRPPAGRRLIFDRASDVECLPIEWLWPGRIALGALTIVAGDPGLGKSLVTTDMAARVTCGNAWIDGSPCPKGSVIMVSAEDDPARTIAPRLEAAWADRSRVHLLKGAATDAPNGKRALSMLSLAVDIPLLADFVRELGDARLIVIDPISAYLGKTDSHNNAEVRAALAPLSELANESGAAIVAVMHLNKGQGKAAYRVSGSLAFTAAARAVYYVAREDGDLDKDRRLFMPIKNNLGPDTSGFCYHIRRTDADPPVPRIEWSPEPLDKSPDDVLEPKRDGSQLGGAMKWLRAEIGERPVLVSDLKGRAKDDGESWITIRRAAEQLGVIKTREDKFQGRSMWSLPSWTTGAQTSLPQKDEPE